MIIVLSGAISGVVAAWGILESVRFAAILTLVEVLGLVIVVTAGIWHQPTIIFALPSVFPDPSDTAALGAIALTSLVAFFAFIGFDGMVNIIEETENPARNMPLGIFITLMISTLLYFSVAAVAVLLLPLEDLSTSAAPISLLFERPTGVSPLVITLIAIAATFNGIVIQTILSSLIIYGMAKVSRLPKGLALLNTRTRTPLIATVLVVFILIHLSLLRIKWRSDPAPDGIFIAPIVVPIVGLISCIAMLAGPFIAIL